MQVACAGLVKRGQFARNLDGPGERCKRCLNDVHRGDCEATCFVCLSSEHAVAQCDFRTSFCTFSLLFSCISGRCARCLAFGHVEGECACSTEDQICARCLQKCDHAIKDCCNAARCYLCEKTGHTRLFCSWFSYLGGKPEF